VPPCFIIVCQNTAISKLVYDFISGFHRKNEDSTTTLENGRLPLFRNFDETTGNALPRPNTLLIDSEQLEAGDALDDEQAFHRDAHGRVIIPNDFTLAYSDTI
jgi:type III restriction enzyme